MIIEICVMLWGLAPRVIGSDSSYPTNNPCVQLEIPVTVSANNTVIESLRVSNSLDASELMLAMDASDFDAAQFSQKYEINGTFTISAQLCVPWGDPKSNILQIATHGVTFDKRYWDSEYNPETYSYVQAALAAGYSILTYDRLGVGQSSKPDGRNVVQPALQVEILKALTDHARAGTLLSASAAPGGGGGGGGGNLSWTTAAAGYRADRLVHVGHSYGSILAALLAARYPATAGDALVLTGWLASGDPGCAAAAGGFGLAHAPSADPAHFAGVPAADYLAIGSQAAYLYKFLAAATFDAAAFAYYWGARQTVTTGDMVSLAVQGREASRQAMAFAGPILIFLGQRDRSFCGASTCDSNVNIEYLKTLWPNASHIETYLQPNTGHLLTSSVNATAGYKALLSWIDDWVH